MCSIMLSKFQMASSYIRIFLLNKRPNLAAFRRQASSSSSSSSSSSVSMNHNKNNNPPNAIQGLYDLCQNTFLPSSFSLPSSNSVQKICSLLDTVGPVDVGLEEENPDVDRGHGFGLHPHDRITQWAQPITFLDIFESNNFTMCIFCFPTSAVIPLHDHPGMTVFSKVLYGSLHVKAYDWVDPPPRETRTQFSSPGRLAKLVKDEVVTGPATSVLYPKSGGNLHCFTAVTPCAILDILAPPYDENARRGCTYFRDHPYAAFSNGVEVKYGKEEDYAWLVEVETPENLYMRQGRYVGPPIQV